MTIIITILMFGLIILIHELGHFTLAKMNGIGVKEFSIGMGPRLISTVKGETRYSLKIFPFGGSCAMVGMVEDGADEEEINQDNSFLKKSIWARMSVIAAGPIMNFVLAYILSLFIIGSIGFDSPIVAGVSENSAAQEMGLQQGDEIVKINNKNIHLYREVSLFSRFNGDKAVDVVYKRDGETHSVTIQPQLSESGTYLMGINFDGRRTKGTALQTLQYGFYEVKYWISMTMKSLQMLVTGQAALTELSGPIGVAGIVQDAYEVSRPGGAFAVLLQMFNLTILISANLGVMNLLPIPAFDGGRIVFLFIEWIRGKKIDPEKEGMINFIGIILIFALMIFVMFNDIRKLF